MHGAGTLQWLGAVGGPTAPWFLARFAMVAVSRVSPLETPHFFALCLCWREPPPSVSISKGAVSSSKHSWSVNNPPATDPSAGG